MNHVTKLGQLRKQLLCHYDISERPSTNLNSPIDVSLSIRFKSYDFKEYGRPLLTVHAWMPIIWNDDHLKWDPAQYESIDKIYVNSKEIWMPDVTLHNSDNGQSILDHTEVNCEVRASGRVWCILPVTFKVACRPDYKKWPEAVQNCWFFFGSWRSTREYINYKEFNVTFAEARKNLQWNVTQTRSRMGMKKVGEKEYPTLSINILLKRFPPHYETYLHPAAMFMTISNLIVYLINPEKHQKLRFSVIFLAMMVFYLIVGYFTWFVYNQGDVVPNILRFFRDSMIITMITLVETTFVRAILERHLTIPIIVQNLIQTKANSIRNITFIEFVPDSGVQEQNIESASFTKKTPIQSLVVQLIDRVMFVSFLITYLIYFVIFLFDWM